jgi:hypothetical protein
MKKKRDTSEEIKMAQFWDCNPYVSVVRSYDVRQRKLLLHWMGITKNCI